MGCSGSRIADADALASGGSCPGASALHWAAWRGDAARLSVLLGPGSVDPGPLSPRDHLGRTPLCLAARGTSLGCLQLLLAAGAERDTSDGEGLTPLHAAASAGSARCVAALLRAGAPLAAEDKRGRTALHQAALRGHAACVAELLAAVARRPDDGSLVHRQDADGFNPLQLAERHLQRERQAEELAPYQQPAGRLHDTQQTVRLLRAAAAHAAARLQPPASGAASADGIEKAPTEAGRRDMRAAAGAAPAAARITALQQRATRGPCLA